MPGVEKGGERQADGARDVALPARRPRLGIAAGEASGRPVVDDLGVAVAQQRQDLGGAADPRPVEAGREAAGT